MGSFVKGTIFLTFVIFLSKLFGFIYRIQFMRIAGEEAVGIYMTSYPAFVFFISVLQLGIPIAVAKIVAELHAKRRDGQLKSVMQTATRWSILSIIIFTPLLYYFIPYLAGTLLHNEATKFTLYIALGAVPIVVFSGLFRGYLQGIAVISATAWSQMLEQVIRIVLITFLLPFFATPDNPAATAGYAMAITAIGELFSFIYLYIHYNIKKKRPRQSDPKKAYPAMPLLRIAVPSAGSRLFGTFTWFLEPIVFLKALTVAGVTAAGATTLYGIISGVHIPLLLFPSFIPNALAIVLIPAVSDAVARNNHHLLNERIGISLRLSSLIGCYAATYFFLHGDELAMRLFHLEENRGFMRILAPIFYFYYIQSPLHSILQAVDEARPAMMNSIYGGLGKLFIMFVLASQPFIQERGAIIAIGFGVLVTSFLHIATLRGHKMISAGFRFFAIPYGIFILTCIIQTFILPILSFDFWTNSVITLIILTVLLILTNQFKWSDFNYLRSILSRRV
ncbi:polysaccharide biosynthesis protein [Lysinibacillus telephonicus]|uniref:Polysaccharide biosynthesis protein n=1 Tax=Lysinibacillus telephonicus TaxID=1714840 RepID=A0A431UWN2_9BACI|nr:polysaccharide biosynthesis protein [Lysinibacillus telephonicus]RTQ95845.1 polysaccharide biosynthesis protein [Lysinibacillus telephonicus]